MKDKNIKFASLDPDFPRQALAAVILVKGGDGSDLLYALKPIFRNVEELKRAMEISVGEFGKINVSLSGVIILPLEFDRNFELKKEYWDNPSIDFGQAARIKHFMDAVKLPKLYQMLVLPEFYDRKNKNWILSAALPFFVSSEDNMIELYMINSKDPVDRRARSAALYKIGKPKGMNWATGKIREFQKKDLGSEEVAN